MVKFTVMQFELCERTKWQLNLIPVVFCNGIMKVAALSFAGSDQDDKEMLERFI